MQDTDEIKARLPIEQVVGKYVPLKKAGRVYKGLCPFHNEKTPSFTVNPDRGIYKCFGCGEGGDIFDFVIKLEGLSFPEALKLLAEQAGVQLTENVPAANPDAPRKDRLFALNAFAAKLWATILKSHPGAKAGREYLETRGLSQESIERFQIGVAPTGTTTGTQLKEHGFTPAEIQAAGDPTRLQNRITFPICDITGRPVGFTGRLYGEAPPNAPKYWNTPETPLFNKGRTVYALHLAKHAIESGDLAILAEGQMDVVMLHQGGYPQAVASSGTALTTDQLRLISRFSRNIAFAYDSDAAGIKATKRGVELALAEELNPYVISIPQGKDPADCIQHNPQLWQRAYADRQPFVRWLLDLLLQDGSELGPQRKKELAAELVPWLKQVKNPLERGDWIRVVAAQIQTDQATLEGMVGTPVAAKLDAQAAPVQSERSSEQERAEIALALLLAHPGTYEYSKEQLSALRSVEPTPFLASTLASLDVAKPSLQEALTAPPDAQKVSFLQAEEVLKPYQTVELTDGEALTEILGILARIRSDHREYAKQEMSQRIRSAQASGDRQQVQALLRELQELV